MVASNRDLLRDSELVRLGVRPVDQPDSFGVLTDARLDVHAVAEQPVDILVGLVEVASTTKRCIAGELQHRLADQVVVIATGSEALSEQLGLDV